VICLIQKSNIVLKTKQNMFIELISYPNERQAFKTS